MFVNCGENKTRQGVGDIAALGDHVTITVLDDGSGVVENVEERKRLWSGWTRARRWYQQVLLANADQVVFVFACAIESVIKNAGPFPCHR